MRVRLSRKTKRKINIIIAKLLKYQRVFFVIVGVALAAGLGWWFLGNRGNGTDYNISREWGGDYAYKNENREFTVEFAAKENKERPTVRFSLRNENQGGDGENEKEKGKKNTESGATGLSLEFEGLKSKPAKLNKYSTSKEEKILDSGAKEKKEFMIFKDVMPATDLTYEIIDQGVEEQIVLKDRSALTDLTQNPSYSFAAVPQGAVPRLTPEGQISSTFIHEKTGEYAFHFLRPVMIDAKGVRSGDIGVFIKPIENQKQEQRAEEIENSKFKNSNSYQVVIQPSLAWLTDSERAYPVRIDPSIVHDESAEFATGGNNRTEDGGSGVSPQIRINNPSGGNDRFTKLLLHADGADESTTFTDSSMAVAQRKTITRYGDTNVETDQSKFGGSSMEFDGTGDYLSVPDSDDWILTGDFTIDMWVRHTTDTKTYFSQQVDANNNQGIYAGGANNLRFNIYQSGAYQLDYDVSNAGQNDGNWHHVAYVHTTSSHYMFVDGVYKAPTSQTFGNPSVNFSAPLEIGRYNTAPNMYMNGYVDELRISKGIARWTSNFTPPTRAYNGEKPYGVFTSPVIDATSNVRWLDMQWSENGVATGDGETISNSTGLEAQWNFNDGTAAQNITTLTNNAGSCGASCNGTLNDFAAGATTGLDGSATEGWTANYGRWPNSSPEALIFDGSDDDVRINNHLPDFVNEFTLEAWVKTNADTSSSSDDIIERRNAGNTGTYGLVAYQNKAYFIYNNNGFTNLGGKKLINDGNWHYIAGVLNSSGTYLYVDGVLENSTNATTYFSLNDEYFYIGQASQFAGYNFPGVLDSIRVYSRSLTANEILSNYNSGNIELQTRSGSSADPNDGTWEEWRPASVSTETAVDAMDSGNASDNFQDGYTKLLLHANGANAGTTFYDNSIPSKTITRAGDAQISTAAAKWGGSSAKFDGTGDYITVPDGDDWYLGNADFTIDFWVNFTALPSNTWAGLVSQRVANGDQHAFEIGYQTNGGNYLDVYLNWGSSNFNGTFAWTPSLATWYHVAVVRNGGTVNTYINGVSQSTISVGNTPIINSAAPLYIGAQNSNGSAVAPFNGYIDELRISKGIARWTGNFTPPTAQYSDPNWLATSDGNIGDKMKLLLHGDGGDGATTFTDSSIYGKRVGVTGDSHIEQDQSKFGGTSMAFDGTGDYISLSDSSDWAFGTGDFTIDTWVRFNDISNFRTLVRTRNDSQGGGSTQLSLSYDGAGYNGLGLRLDVYYGGASLLTLTQGNVNGWQTDQWYHVAVVRNGNAWNLYRDGVSVASTSASITVPDVNARLTVGSTFREDTGAVDFYLNGYLDDLRITKGKALWTANFTPPASAVTNPTVANNPVKMEGTADMKVSQGTPQCDGNTVALWHLDETGGSNAYVSDSCGGNFGTPSGTTVVDGWSGKARSFAGGNNNYVAIPDSPLLDLGSTFTIQAWFKYSYSASSQILLSKGLSDANEEYTISISPTGQVYWDYGDGQGYVFTVAGSVKPDVWQHIAVVYNSSASPYGKVYVNGQEVGLSNNGASAHISNSGAQYLYIGTGNGGTPYYGSSITGTVDEVRIDNVVRSPEEIAETYRAGRDHRITRTTSSTDFSGKSKLPFYVAADRSGTFMEATVGESAYANYESDANTSGLWHLDEQSGSGAYIKDSSTNGNHGTPTGTTFTEGKVGKARSFNGSSDYINLGSNSSIDDTFSGGGTISLWLRANSTGGGNTYKVFLGKYDGYYAYLQDLSGNDAKVAFFHTFNGGNHGRWSTTNRVAGILNSWVQVVITYNRGSTTNDPIIYINGVPQALTEETAGVGSATSDSSNNLILGDLNSATHNLYGYSGTIDEFVVSKGVIRTADEIRQTYEVGRRTHPITIDFAGGLSGGNLIADSNDLSFTVGTSNGATVSSYNPMTLYAGEKVIIKENYDGQEYLAQGTVTAANTTTGAVTVLSWDANSTFPTGGQTGYSANAMVFKWQREFWDVTGMLDSQVDASTRLTLRTTDGSEGRNIWLDDFKSSSNYLTAPAATSNVTSSDGRYFQYRTLFSTSDRATTPYLSQASVGYDLSQNSSIFTAEAWVYPESSVASKAIVAKANELRIVTDASGNPLCQVASDSWQTAATASTAISTGQWTHLACAYDKSTLKLYVNGVEKASVSVSVDLNNGNGDLKLGSDDSTGSTYGKLNGVVDDLRFYNYARSGEQILEDMMAGGSGTVESGDNGRGGLAMPALHWKFDEGYGATANDSGSNNNDGTVSGAAWSKEGKFRNALDFEADETDYVSVADSASLSITGDTTVSAWIKPESVTADTQFDIAGKWDGANESYLLAQYGDEIRMYIDGAANYKTTNAANLQAGTWYHVAGSYDASAQTVTLYVNGKATAGTVTGTIPASIGDDAGVFQVGAEDTSTATANKYDGLIDEVKVYPYTLSAHQVSLDQNERSQLSMGSSGTDASGNPTNATSREYCVPGSSTGCLTPIAEWRFEEKTGTTAHDLSNNSHDGTLTGGPTWGLGKNGSGVNFDGTDDYIAVADGANSIKSMTEGSVSYWFKPSTTTGQVFVLGDSDASSYFVIGTNNNKIGFRYMKDGVDQLQGDTGEALTLNQWYYVTFSVNGSGNRLYVNGVKKTVTYGAGNAGTSLFFSDNSANWDSVWIGARNSHGAPGGYFSGSIDQVRLYTYDRTQAQIAWEYNRGKPVGEWRFEEGENTTIHDDSGNGINTNGTLVIGSGGTQSAAGTYNSEDAAHAWYNGVSGKYNRALSLDGTDDYVSFALPSEMTSANVSVAAWVKPAAIGVERPVMALEPRGADGNGRGVYMLIGADGRVTVKKGSGDGSWETVTGTTALTANNWYHLLGAYDGATLKLYVNGKLDGSLSDAAAIVWTDDGSGYPNPGTGFIGGFKTNVAGSSDTVPDSFFTGLIDDARVYNYALTAEQASLLHNANAAVRFGD